jgi:hypothetical protein
MVERKESERKTVLVLDDASLTNHVTDLASSFHSVLKSESAMRNHSPDSNECADISAVW